MSRQDADKITSAYVKPVFGFALKRCRNWQDAKELQSLFQSDAWFIPHCLVTLVQNGRLKEPEEEQKNALTKIILHV